MGGRATIKKRLREARLDVVRRDEHIANMASAHQRLTHLYDISKLLTRFDSVDDTVPEVLSLAGKTFPLRSAILLLDEEGSSRAIVWQARYERASELREAISHASIAYGYLVRSHVRFDGATTASLRLPPRPAGPELSRCFLLLPLVVDGGKIFGALQIGVAGRVGESDLAFINSIVNQLAIALDRQTLVRARQEAAEHSEREQRLLGEVSAVVSGSLNYQGVLSKLTRFAVPRLADLCIVEELGEPGRERRLAVSFADEHKQQTLAQDVCVLASGGDSGSPGAQVVASGRSLRFDDVAASTQAGDAACAAAIHAAGMRSLMALPLVARGQVRGVLILATAESERRYTARDLAMAERIARRAAIGIDNARLYDEAQRATAARENLLAIVSHDLRNPLSVISMSLTMVHEPVPEDRRKSRKHHEAIERATRRMARLVDDLLESASIDAGRLSVARRSIEVAPLLRQTVEALQPLADSHSQTLSVDLPADVRTVHADEVRIDQVFANLIGNAIKFTPRGGAITITVRQLDDEVAFAIADTGPGIPAESHPHLFDRFWQAGSTAHLGNGLGLFIVKGIVEAHGGRVWVDSVIGEGTTFSFTLPCSSGRALDGTPAEGARLALPSA